NIIIYYSYFFFQAEDGIRYFHVTGVQTCALPISIIEFLPVPPPPGPPLAVRLTPAQVLGLASAAGLRGAPPQSIAGHVALYLLQIGRASGRESVVIPVVVVYTNSAFERLK